MERRVNKLLETTIVYNAVNQSLFAQSIIFSIFFATGKEIFCIFAASHAENSPSKRLFKGWDVYIKRRYLTLWFDVLKSGKFQNLCQKTKQRERFMGCLYNSLRWFHSQGGSSIYIYVGLRRCSFRQRWQFRSLNTWDERQSWLHVFCVYLN
jgi:hypothetical protein